MRQQEGHFLLKIQSEFAKLSRWQYFEPTVLLFTVLLFFLLGRKTYQSKFTQILSVINDAENEKRRLKELSQQRNTALGSLRTRLPYLKVASVLLLLLAALYAYLNGFRPSLQYLGVAGALLLLSWLAVLCYIQYQEMMVARTEGRLQRKSISSEGDTREVMSLLGEPLCNALKAKFEREAQMQRQNEELKECDLKKCYDQKKTSKELYALYKAMITQMQQMAWCEVCSQELNTEANDLKLAEVEGRVKTYRSVAGSLGLEKKKELTNKLLEEWERLESKLPKICKRGCCIRFRVAIEETKRTHQGELTALKTRLAAK